MKKMFLAFFAVAGISAAAATAFTSISTESGEKLKGFDVFTMDGSGWVKRATVNFDMNFSEKTVDLSGYLPDSEGRYRVRIVHGPEGMANLDGVMLSIDRKKTEPKEIFEAGNKTDLWLKLSKIDNDVINAQGKTIEADFTNKNAGTKSVKLKITGREENPGNIPGTACVYPSALHPSETNSELFTYEMGKNYGSINVDGEFTAYDFLGKPAFASLTSPITGHPEGYTYGYVKNDENYLYAGIDFTPDNTYDGLADFGAVLIKTKNGWKKFKVSVDETTWGKAGFTYTNTVAYQHKVYEFKIPLSELDISDEKKGKLQIKFLAYGTAACILEKR